MQTCDTQAILERLEKLERQNRRMKRAGIVVLVLLSVVVLMAQATTHQVLTAKMFILVDANGKTRASLDMVGGAPGLSLYDAKGNAFLSTSADGPYLLMNEADGKQGHVMHLSSDSILLKHRDIFQAELAVDADGPQLKLRDFAGFQSTLGVVDLDTPRTGESRKTSAASIVLFGKDKKVIWSAP